MKKRNILIAGCSGYYGHILVDFLSREDFNVYGIDLNINLNLDSDKILICDISKIIIFDIFKNVNFDIVINLATNIDFASSNQFNLYNNNIEITKYLAEFCVQRKVNTLIFTSSNSIFLGNKSNTISQSEVPIPIDYYGKSKVDSENILKTYQSHFNIIIFRCPNIIDAGRLGMLTILFELLYNNANLWILGKGEVFHQCIYAQDLNTAILKAINKNKSNVFNIGSDNTMSFKDIYLSLIKLSGSKSKVRSLPTNPSILILKLLKFLKLSPMGPYQFRMLTQNFQFDTTFIKNELEWTPTLNTAEILAIAYNYYLDNNLINPLSSSANSKHLNMGILSFLKFIKF